MFNFFKRLSTNLKARKLILNFLEPMIGKNKEYCKGAAQAHGFLLLNEEAAILDFVRQDISQKLLLNLRFNEKGHCGDYMLFFNNPSENLMNSNFIDRSSAREAGLVN